ALDGISDPITVPTARRHRPHRIHDGLAAVFDGSTDDVGERNLPAGRLRRRCAGLGQEVELTFGQPQLDPLRERPTTTPCPLRLRLIVPRHRRLPSARRSSVRCCVHWNSSDPRALTPIVPY